MMHQVGLDVSFSINTAFVRNMSIQIDVADLSGTILEGILYGIFLSLFVATMYILLTGKHHQSRPNIPMIFGAVLMFILATIQISLDTANIFLSFIDLDRTHRIEFLTDPKKAIWAARGTTFFAMMIVGDVIVIYRTFIVWGRNFWVILVPVCCIGESGGVRHDQTHPVAD
ncbi:hypothetical protein BD410DRAFT_551036 [Rickenella mellea]|uniref:Uncharacterized protein n=1 Tax=Rickenella mellea TaxID=50990 RepID=A0A4Y7PQF8_9AGAM|nr:hypothetical protein BD410DRAFT_551036 [Rickenella mellea]